MELADFLAGLVAWMLKKIEFLISLISLGLSIAIWIRTLRKERVKLGVSCTKISLEFGPISECCRLVYRLTLANKSSVPISIIGMSLVNEKRGRSVDLTAPFAENPPNTQDPAFACFPVNLPPAFSKPGDFYVSISASNQPDYEHPPVFLVHTQHKTIRVTSDKIPELHPLEPSSASTSSLAQPV